MLDRVYVNGGRLSVFLSSCDVERMICACEKAGPRAFSGVQFANILVFVWAVLLNYRYTTFTAAGVEPFCIRIIEEVIAISHSVQSRYNHS